MKKLAIITILSIFLISLAVVSAITGSAIVNTDNDNKGNQNDNSIQTINQEHIKNITQEKNKFKSPNGECQDNCTCTGSVTKCELNGGREMTIRAGNSGNIIIQIQGQNTTTNVTLYKSDGKLYGVFNNNETRRILTPEQIQERIQKRLEIKNCSCNMTLTEEGYYEIQTNKKARLFLFIPVREKVDAKISAENGEIVKIRNPWWGWLAKDTKEEPLLGSSCGTVTPGMNDECCQTKGYDKWDTEKGDCILEE